MVLPDKIQVLREIYTLLDNDKKAHVLPLSQSRMCKCELVARGLQL